MAVVPRRDTTPADKITQISFFTFYLSCHTTHTTTAERRVDKPCRRRGVFLMPPPHLILTNLKRVEPHHANWRNSSLTKPLNVIISTKGLDGDDE